MRGQTRAAYSSWCDQRARCYNPDAPAYPRYGGRGIKVQYTSREFIGWWITEYIKNKLSGMIVCGRINHAGNYNFENIRLETQTTNAKEVVGRRLFRKIRWVKLDGTIIICESIKSASALSGMSTGVICWHCKGIYKTSRVGTFQYEK